MTMIWRTTVATCLMAGALGLTRPAAAQYQTRPWLQWRTIETSHFSVHYPSELETWARSVASKMEAVDSAVRRIVGYAPTHRVQIVVDDPFRLANGSAWPFMDAPALVFWATPPNPREDIGTNVSWADMLASHEFAHLAHLTRPSRNPLRQAIWNLLPVDFGPIPLKTPRWVIEGYATYIEGVVTGSGRPNGAWRPTILRQWALEGRLPTYDQLSGASGMYGGELAYLGGSAFIEWLAARQGDSSLVHLWRRLSAKRDRAFDDAFAGVYGESPTVLYGRFTTELTATALEAKRLRASPTDSGQVIQHLVGETGDPAISRDGGRVAILIKPTTKPARIVIWSTVPEPDTAAERERKQLARTDPEDVPSIRVFPPTKKAISTLYAVGNLPYQGPRFLRDGRVVVWRNAAVGDGSYAPDLFIWDPQRHTVRRVTRAANVREGDPSPDGDRAVALRCGGGHCDVVLVDIRSGRVTALATGSETRSFYRPRFSPDGERILTSVHYAGQWRLAMISARNGAVALLGDAQFASYDAAFADDSTVIATSELAGIPTLSRVRVADGGLTPLVHITGAAVGGDFNAADRSVWFLALHSRGWDLRSTPLDRAPAMTLDSSALFGVRARVIPHELPTGPIGAPHRFGLGPRKWVYLPGTAWSDEGASITLSLVNSDIVGRHELLVQWQGGLDESWQGTSAAITSRASRLPWTASGFMVRQGGFAPISTVLHGGAFSIEASHRVETSFRRLTLGGTVADLQTSVGPDGLRQLGFATVVTGISRYGDGTRTSLQLSASGVAGTSGGAAVRRGTVSATIELGPNPLVVTGTAGAVNTTSPFEQFSIGGLTPVLLHPSVLSQRIAMPVLPTTYAIGKTLLTYRASLPVLGARLYWWVAKVGNDSSARWQHVQGLEWSTAIPQVSIVGTPAARITAGVGTWVDGPRDAPLFVDGVTYFPRRRSLTQLYIMTQLGDWAR